MQLICRLCIQVLAVPWSNGWAAVGCDVHAKVVVWCGVAGSVARVGALQSAVLC